ncbi:hypothetical protein BJX99DRAFT_252818 [Aspergillus californicus]
MSKRPQFYENTLEIPHINEATLTESLHDLRAAVQNGVRLIEAEDRPRGVYDGRGIFTGELGIALTYLRLAQQTPSLGEGSGSRSESARSFYALAAARIPEYGPNLPLRIGGLSPLAANSPVAPVVLRILHKAATGAAGTIADTDLLVLSDAVKLALSHGPVAEYNGHELGADEVLFGRAGLLWALLNVRARIAEFPPRQQEFLLPVLECIPGVLDVVFEDGREGRRGFVGKNGDRDALPLMWTWIPGFYGIGWAHGLTGILPILLACPKLTGAYTDYLPEIGQTITALCKLCIAHEGHLPVSIPSRGPPRASPLVQVCHGAPAILGLLGCAMKDAELVSNHWEPAWDEAARLATERVWEEGLLSKGGGLCHGIAGNAWPLLLLHDAYEYTDTLRKGRENYAARAFLSELPDEICSPDFFLSRALAMLLHARETRPYNRAETGNEYRVPDHPYSLFEGLAGTVCAWADACAVLQARLRKMELAGVDVKKDQKFKEYIQQQLGFPFLGGNGVAGVL